MSTVHIPQRLSASPWFDLLASPIIWGVYFLVVYGLAEVACQTGFLNALIGGLSALSVVVLGLTVVALLATLYAGLVAYRNLCAATSLSAENEAARLETQARRFVAVSGLWLCALFALTLLVTGLPALVLNPCQ